MKVYRVGFLNSDAVGLFTNKKTARKYMRGYLSLLTSGEGYLYQYTIPVHVVEGEKIPRSFAVTVNDYHRAGRLITFLIEYISEHFDFAEDEECIVKERK